MVSGPQAFYLARRFEGLLLIAYKHEDNVWTIGYGHTRDVSEGQGITKQMAEQLLAEDFAAVDVALARLVKVELTQNEYDAVADFTFNLGEGHLGTSTLLKLINESRMMEARLEFAKWIRSKGKVLPGLVRRRAAEALLFANL